ncbi:hypothetical protein [Natronobeatus ordinarius]|uniref:hypothetical protein n=1 Tax=Natronobeatus ordinarius TaxID=2963433 RepID=UPI0020CCE1BB|nr:hypothetical protein [Natronobeatus ordinarius]
MKLTRRHLFAALAGGSSLALLAETEAVSSVGVGHAAAVDTADDEASLSLEGGVLSEPVSESDATLTIDSRLEDVTVTVLEADAFAFEPTPPFSLAQPVTVDVSVAGDRTGVVTDTVTVVLEGPDVGAAVERTAHVERADAGSGDEDEG